MNFQMMVILFHTNNHAIRAETVLKRLDIKCKLIPVPRHLSSDCGVCLRLPESDLPAAVAALADKKVEIAGQHGIQS